MDGGLLVAAQISSLFPSSQIACIPLQTSRRDAPLPPPPKDSNPPAEHAIYSSVLHTPTTGTILLRVIHDGLILELISLSTDVAPIRFVFPAAIVPTPAVFLWGSSELHILAVTKIGSLFRVIIPILDGRNLWRDHAHSYREYLIRNIVTGTVDGPVHVQGPHCVVIALSNGSILRVETEHVDEDDDHWSETVYQYGSFLHSLTSFLPHLGAGSGNGADIISMASHPWHFDNGYVWTLSRDRTLRFWKTVRGCVASKTLPSSLTGRESTPGRGTSVNGAEPTILLEAERRTLLRVFSTGASEGDMHVLAFIPTPSSSTSGGDFHLFNTADDRLHDVGTIACSQNSAHCHLQDFMITGNTLYTLWDRQGQSTIESTTINTDPDEQDPDHLSWKIASYAQESELTPTYLEELLLSPGSLTDKFFEAIMRPGVFSALTLRTAIDQYTNACLSLPGTPPPQLSTTYATLGENIAAVVGCTVNLIRDPQTGALQHAKYWNALKRDWEGFIARCREVERSARWPLSLGVGDALVIVVERERVGSLVAEDLPIALWRILTTGKQDVGSQYSLLSILWTLRSKLGPQSVLNLESRLVDIMHQEMAFSFADILQDQARRANFKDDLNEGLESWIVGRLQSIDDIDAATRTTLDVIGGFDMGVKQEEDEVQLLLPTTQTDWSRALTAAYISTAVDARYDLCLTLVTILFFLSDELSQWDPSLLAEVFAVFRGIAMLRSATRQPAADICVEKSPADDSTDAEDVVVRLRNMQVSRSRTLSTPTYSLVHRLLAQSGDIHGLPGAAHHFLDASGLLQSTSPAHATRFEVLFCERLRLLGYQETAREMLAWLPRTPGVTYVLARLWLSVGRADDASYLMEKLSGSFGRDSALTLEDKEALASVLPGAELFDSEFSFCLHAASLFKSALLIRHEVLFSQLALSVAPVEVDTSSMWYSVIKGYIDLGLYDDAYASLISSPYEKQKRECVSQLVYRMCDDGAVEKLMTFNFAGFSEEVEDALAFKARNVDPRIQPSYSRILYTWYVFRSDYRKAAATMYQRVQKLKDLMGDPSLVVFLAEEQLEAYIIAINSLSLLDRKSAWIVVPILSENSNEPRKRRRLSRYIPESLYAPGKHDAEIIDLTDLQYEYALLSAQVDLARKDPTLFSSGEFLLPPSSIVLRLAQSNRFNTAMAVARSLKVDMTDLFAHLTGQCLRLSRNPDAVIQEDTSDWLLTDKISSWSGTPADRGWRYLRQSLERHDNSETDYKYSKTALETIVGFDRLAHPPPWLIHSLEKHHHEYLIRMSLRYDILENALEHTLSMIKKADSQLARDHPTNAFSTWLPYTLIDQVLIAAAAPQNGLSPRGETLRQQLHTEMSNRVKRMQKLSQFSR